MQIAYTTTFNARDVHNWSGTPYHMSHALAQSGLRIEYIQAAKRVLPPFFKAKQVLKKYLFNQRESPRFNVTAAKHYSLQVANQLQKIKADVILSPLINPIAYLETKSPIVLWTDALYSALLGFYPDFAAHSTESVNQGNLITQSCLGRCKLAIFSSDWAARSAMELYGLSRDKIHVVPYGANLEAAPTQQEVNQFIKERDSKKIRLLFLAKSWERKGGDIAVSIARELYSAGHAVELTLVGYAPKTIGNLPYVTNLGFISKQTNIGKAKIRSLLAQSHFLLLPSRADACPMVFAEANAFGLPCLTTYVGGIATAVKNNVNGMTFGLDASAHDYCNYITNLLANQNHYQALCLSALNEYQTRLNWQAATQEVGKLLREL